MTWDRWYPLGWDIGLTFLMGPSPRPSWTSDSTGNSTKGKLYTYIYVLGLEDWIPWPDLDAASSAGQAAPAAAAVAANAKSKEPSPLDALESDNDKNVCRQIADMGFPLDRTVRACGRLGPDSGKIINFCLTVASYVESERLPELEV